MKIKNKKYQKHHYNHRGGTSSGENKETKSPRSKTRVTLTPRSPGGTRQYFVSYENVTEKGNSEEKFYAADRDIVTELNQSGLPITTEHVKSLAERRVRERAEMDRISEQQGRESQEESDEDDENDPLVRL